MFTRRPLTLVLATALVLTGCTNLPTHSASTKPKSPADGTLVAGSNLIGEGGGAIIANNGGQLTGSVKIPAGVISNNSSSLVSDHAGAIVANNTGNLIANNGGGVISNNAGGLVSNNAGSFHVLALDEKPAAKFTVTIVDAAGKPVLDEGGKPYQAVTGEDGGYTFTKSPRGHNLVVRVELPAAVGAMLAYLPDGAEGSSRQADVGGSSTLVMGYVLAKFVKTQSDPNAVLQKLPADVEAATRAKAASALGDGAALASFRTEALLPTVEGLEKADPAFAQQVDAVRKLLVSGLSDAGEGQSATGVGLSVPRAVDKLSDGSLLVVERDGHRVRRVDLATGIITTYAGKSGATAIGDNGPASEAFIDRPVDVAVDSKDNVYICDFGHCAVRRVDAKTHVITTVAGTGVRRESTDAVAATGVKATTQPLKFAVSVEIDAQDRPVFKSEDGVLRIEPNGTLTLLVPPDDAPVSLAAGPGRTIYGFANGSGAILKLDGDAMAPVTLPLHPAGDSTRLAVGPDGAFYLSEDDQISVLPPNGQWGKLPFTASHGGLDGMFLDAGGLVVCDSELGRVWELPLGGGVGLTVAGLPDIKADSVAADALSLNRPSFVLPMGPGHMLVADGLNSVIWEERPDGNFYRFAGGTPAKSTDTDFGDGGPAKDAKLFKVATLAKLADGTVLVCEADPPIFDVRAITPDGTISKLALPDGLTSPAVMAEEKDGSILVSNFLPPVVGRWKGNTFTPLTLDVKTIQPAGLLPQPDGSFYLADAKADTVWKIDTAGHGTVVAGGNGEGFEGDGGQATAAKLYGPLGLIMGPDGNLYVSDARNDRVRRIDMKTGIITTVVGVGGVAFAGTTVDDSLKEPVGIAFEANGDLRIADSGHNQLKRVEAAKLK